MKYLRYLNPGLAIVALLALFLLMPETPNVFGIFKCKACLSTNPYFPLIGTAYFASLFAVSLLFPSFPSQNIAKGGFVWAALLAVTLTYLKLPNWCIPCLIGHACNILIWTIWLFASHTDSQAPSTNFRERLYLAFLAPISIVALFSGLNLTFMAYNFKANHHVAATGLQVGDTIPAFSAKTIDGLSFNSANVNSGILINFVMPDCHFCKEQLPILSSAVKEVPMGTYRFINITPSAPEAFIQLSTNVEWVEDKESALRKLFKVSGYPTLLIIGPDGKIKQVIAGIPEDLKSNLLNSLKIILN